MFKKSKWIWTKNNKTPNNWVRFFCEFDVNEIPKSAVLNISAETKYYFYINETLIVFDGGLFRESSAGCGYYDEVDIARYIRSGANTMTIDVWFYGNGGRNNCRLESAGLIFECEALNIYSGNHIKSGKLNAYYSTSEPNPSYLYGGHNIGFNSNNDYVEFSDSVEHAKYGDQPFNHLEKRPIPLFCFSENVSLPFVKDGETYTVTLPYAMHFSPYMVIEADGEEIIDIRSDRYQVNGGPGDNFSSYKGHRYEYICKKGQQVYCGYNWIFGEKIHFKIPNSVRVIALGYRESGYSTKLDFPRSNDQLIDSLIKKCVRTLYVCMRENFMDCPDRERGQWIGDVSVQAPQIFYCMDDNAVLLLKKTIHDFIKLKKGNVLVGNVPGENFCELPSQSLNAISENGMLAVYYQKTGDKETLAMAYQPVIDYLKLWVIDEEGLIVQRKGNWYWFDHGYNVDERVLENCWYYSALKFALFMAGELGIEKDNDFLKERINSISSAFDRKFWNGSYYTSKGIADDRANAMAVISGLATADKYLKIRQILISVFNSTTYMEYYVLEALCIMGYKEYAYKRMISRYYPLIINDNTTLWEDFFILGTKNHAWSGSPLTIINKYFKELMLNQH